MTENTKFTIKKLMDEMQQGAMNTLAMIKNIRELNGQINRTYSVLSLCPMCGEEESTVYDNLADGCKYKCTCGACVAITFLPHGGFSVRLLEH